ncbi:MAG: DUF4174 domain-containing protein [Paracoccus sp. (in: a-proteobacteria)]|uniref:DUF4174 domain-containing protein n=1 Tax=Paracoccus sp. TaxID=267 RepID=UPI00391DAC44
MKLKFLIFAMALAAMGPGRNAPPPDPQAPPGATTATDRTTPQRNPARLPPVSSQTAPETAAPGSGMTSQGAVGPDGLQIVGSTEVEPAQFLWTQRPIVVFADTPDDPAFAEQMRMLTQGASMLVPRDVVVITDTDPQAGGVWRRQLRPAGFSLVIIDKDGQVKQRKPFPWSVREIGRAIDRFPLRRQETGRASPAR